MIKDCSLCWYVVFTMNILPCDSLGSNRKCEKDLEIKSPPCSDDYVLKPQCMHGYEGCRHHPTKSQPFTCKFFAQPRNYDSIIKWIVLFIKCYVNLQSWTVQHSTCWYSVQVHVLYTCIAKHKGRDEICCMPLVPVQCPTLAIYSCCTSHLYSVSADSSHQSISQSL